VSIGTKLAPILTGINVSDQSGTHSDTATVDLNDEGGKIVFPKVGAAIRISLGWEGGAVREVFAGTVDEAKSSGNRGGGMLLSITAKGFDATGKAKEAQERHFDGQTVDQIMTAAASDAGLSVDVDPDIAGEVIPYIDMRGESLLHFGQRLARMVGASFRVQGDRAVIARRASDYTPTITVERGVNLHSWDITPLIGRAAYGETQARYFDRANGVIETVKDTTGLDATAVHMRREIADDEEAAKRAAKSDAAVSKERSGGGQVTIEGNPDAIPDGLCVLIGARAGIDGSYRIKGVSHSYTRGSGFVTTLELAHPQGEAGKDSRAGKPGPSSTGPTDYREVIGEMSGE
jgi:phage protein D